MMAPPEMQGPAPRANVGNRTECLIEPRTNTKNAPAAEGQINAKLRWQKREYLAELAETNASLAISLVEAAWRGDDKQSLVLLRQSRLVLIEAISLGKELAESAEGVQ